MSTIALDGYGPGSPVVYVVSERVLTFHEIDYNGCFGTKIILDTGKEVLTSSAAWYVAEEIERAVRGSHQ